MQPTNEPLGAFGDKLVVQDSTTSPTIGDEPQRSRSLVGLVRRRLGQRGRKHPRLGLDEWTRPDVFGSEPRHQLLYHYPKCPDFAFQFHHQPFVYYSNYAPGTAGRTHLRDETEFEHAAQTSTSQCNLDAVSFVKPIGEENEHPGYASESNGSTHLIELLQMIDNSACAKDTMVVVTYDEFGGQWDHVSPPGQGNNNGPHDQWGPGRASRPSSSRRSCEGTR